MVNYLFSAMILLGFIIALFTGNMKTLGEASINAASDAAKMCIGLVGSYALWLGLINVLRQAGMLKKLANGLSRVIGGLFKGVEKGSESAQYIALNLSANMLGMGNAATPFGLRAMEELQKLNADKKVATHAMCMFIIINASSVQLLPLNVIALRNSLGSTMSASIIVPTLLATTVSTLVGILCGKIFGAK